MAKEFISVKWIEEVKDVYVEGLIDLTAKDPEMELWYSESSAAAIRSFLPMFVEQLLNPSQTITIDGIE